MECWGAQGGDHIALGGRGAYVRGITSSSTNITLYIYVGSQGHATTSTVNGEKEFNGGGPASGQPKAVNVRFWSSGGGATDIRLTNGNWDNFTSLKSRLIIAAGGGGIFYENDDIIENGGYGGALVGGNAIITLNYPGYGTGGSGGTQTTGGFDYEPTGPNNIPKGNYSYGEFGVGGYRRDYYTAGLYCASGGGGGYYGGGGSAHVHSAGGGSSFISGHTGCNAISESSTSSNIIHTGQPNHYSGYIFTNTVMKAGNESMPKPTGGTETGHSGNGYCKITWHPTL